MKINYNEIDKSIEIKDGLKSHFFIMKMLMILTLLNVILNLYDVNKNELGFIEIIWFILGIISLVSLYFFIIKKSTLEKIPIEKIKRLNEKSIFVRKRFSIELSDGKKRDLTEMKSQAEFNELKKLFSEIGILN